jgi:hypothetical protein
LKALSGTPFGRSPRDIEGYIEILRDLHVKHWAESRELRNAGQEEYQEICSQYDHLVRNYRKAQPLRRTVFRQAIGEILHNLMIRRTTNSKWLDGKRIVKLKPNWYNGGPQGPSGKHPLYVATQGDLTYSKYDYNIRENAQQELDTSQAKRQRVADDRWRGTRSGPVEAGSRSDQEQKTSAHLPRIVGK